MTMPAHTIPDAARWTVSDYVTAITVRLYGRHHGCHIRSHWPMRLLRWVASFRISIIVRRLA